MSDLTTSTTASTPTTTTTTAAENGDGDAALKTSELYKGETPDAAVTRIFRPGDFWRNVSHARTVADALRRDRGVDVAVVVEREEENKINDDDDDDDDDDDEEEDRRKRPRRNDRWTVRVGRREADDDDDRDDGVVVRSLSRPGGAPTHHVAFENCRLVVFDEDDDDDDSVTTDTVVVVETTSGVVVDVARGGPSRVVATARRDCGGARLAPGLVDLQTNGAFGVDFSCLRNVDDVRRAARGLASGGVASFCPTLVSASSPDVYRRSSAVLRAARDARGPGEARVVGIHLEGPFFAPDRRGAHDAAAIRDPTRGAASLTDAYGENVFDDDLVRVVTLAPERPGALEVVEALSERGVVVSCGHTDATLEQGREATRRGATMLTHLFNAMRPFHHREPGLLGLLSETDGRRPCYGVIADGVHAHSTALRLAHALHPEGVVLVTDAMSAAGLGDGTHTLGGSVRVRVENGRATVAGTDTLAGSVASMEDCVRTFRSATGCSVGAALKAASRRPCDVIGWDGGGRIERGRFADLVLLDDDLRVKECYVGGIRADEAPKK